MFFRILKLDLKKKKVMNVLILIFITLTTIFFASGLNNIVTVLNGTDYYFDKAGVGDYALLTTGDNKIFEILDNSEAVKNYRYDTGIAVSKENLKIQGNKIDSNSNIIFQSLENSSIHFFDKDNNEIQNVLKGEVYTTANFMKDNNLSVGDKISVELDDIKIDLKIAGKAKDAFLGSGFIGTIRLIINDDDYKIIKEHLEDNDSLQENTSSSIVNRAFYIETDNPSEIEKCLSDATSVKFKGRRDSIKLCYVMDLIVAFIVLALSVCLIIVALLILKFTITFTINDEYREIGVMKAIGINNKSIRELYIVKYFSLAFIGAVIGFIISNPFGDMLIKSAAENMVLGNSVGNILNIIGAILVVLITVLFAYIYTRKVKKASPVDAIRNGQTGERYKSKTIYKLKNSHVRLNLYLAINDILSAPRRFITIIISFFLCLIFVLGIVITTDTMKSKNLITNFCTESDAYFMPNDAQDMFKYKSVEELDEKMIKKYEKLFAENGMPCKISVDLQYSYKISFNGNTYNLRCQKGFHIKPEDYSYNSGITPLKENEIAITDKVSEMTGAKIGDKVKVDLGDGEKELIITASYSTLNYLGEIIRFSENVPTDYDKLAGSQYFQVDFLDNPSADEINNRIQKMRELLDTDAVYDAPELCRTLMTGVADTMETVQYLLLAITIIIVMLVIVLMELSFVANEKSQIALLKAIGFEDKQIIKWHIYRFFLVAVVSAILAAILAIPITELWCNPIFGMMGSNHINYYINPIKLFLIYPGIVVGVTIIVSWLSALVIKKIKSSDTANIE